MAVVPLKSKMTAYLLWFFLGWCSAHKFYLEKVGVGILYLLTGQLFGIGWVIDLFTLGSQVDTYNLLHGGSTGGGMQTQNVVVNVTTAAVPQQSNSEDIQKQNS
jgi:TM2 domain-containing membrane protein YozV